MHAGPGRIALSRPDGPAYPTPHLTSRAIILSLTLAVFGGLFWLLLRPLYAEQRTLQQVAHDLGEGNLSRRMPTSRILLPELVDTFNQMAERTESLVESQQPLLHAVGHELRSPLARMQLSAELLLSAKEPAERTARADEIQEDLEDLSSLVSEVLDHARLGDTDQGIDFELVDLAAVCQRAARRVEGVEVVVPEGIVLRCEERLLSRVLLNLLRNARRHTRTTVRLSAQEEGGAVVIVVEDDGPGFSGDNPERFLAPFVSGGSHPGHGLGLAIVSRILTRHGGEVVLSRSAMGGAQVETMWPV